ncbi:MAG: 4Fe-4S binding protein [Methanosphaera sp.]|uniref:4Fe-4S binding protein n=1 Tax=Methanosphaera sp. BMS TaxID=1789762 RepID=UPI000DC1C062|nr:4Fe-4S dicluster domain-containing protein [Methanosphaera sp. BMS]AWX31896.1 ferredoxin [Methanosphaera sp. BMS]MBQ6443314.1 4Fe-4S binding protein [Methanosphaera sp.]MBR3214533.1 4Fe-4S binding protein [Methanosphaera sp.]
MNININYDDCIGYGCLECLDICPKTVFDIEDKQLIVKADSSCCGCRVCMDVCPTSAILIEY